MEALERILGIVLPVIVVIAVGFIFARLRGDVVRNEIGAVNRLSMEILAPLLIFTALAAKDFDVVHNLTLIAAGILITVGSGLLAWPVAKLLGYDVRSFVPPMMYNNCGNMGLPLAVMAFGQSGLSQAAALFMAGTVVYFTLGIRIIEAGHGARRTAFIQFFMSPIMLSMIVGLTFALLHLHLPQPLFEGLRLLGSASIPIMLFALGVRMVDVNLRSWHIGLIGAVVCPVAGLAVAWLLDKLLRLTPDQRGQMYLFASLPPAVFCFLIAERYQQEPDKVASIVLLGNLAAVVFVPAGLWFGLK